MCIALLNVWWLKRWGLGKKMHSGKSRNDQVATDVRLYVKDRIEEINDLMHGCFKALYNFANDHKETVFPGFTHLQIAQPVVLGHHVLAYFEIKAGSESLCGCV